MARNSGIERSWHSLIGLRGLATLALILAVGSATTFVISPTAYTDPGEFLEVARSLGAGSVLIFVLLGLIRPLTLLPSSIYVVTAGALFGTVLGTAAAVTGQIGGAILVFFLSRRLGRDGMRTLLGNRLAGTRLGSGFTAVLFGRLMPIFPGDAVSIAAGISGMKLRPYLSASLLGIGLSAVLFAFLGDALSNRSGSAIWLASALLVIMVVLSLAWRRFLVRE